MSTPSEKDPKHARFCGPLTLATQIAVIQARTDGMTQKEIALCLCEVIGCHLKSAIAIAVASGCTPNEAIEKCFGEGSVMKGAEGERFAKAMQKESEAIERDRGKTATDVADELMRLSGMAPRPR